MAKKKRRRASKKPKFPKNFPKEKKKLFTETMKRTPKKRRAKKTATPFGTKRSNRGSAQETLNKQTQTPVPVPGPAALPETKPKSETIPSAFQQNLDNLNLVKRIQPKKQKPSSTPFFI